MGSLRSWTSDRFEAVDDDGNGSSNKHQHHLTDSDDDDDNKSLQNCEQQQQQQPAMTTVFRVSNASSSTDQHHHHQLLSENHMPTTASAAQGMNPEGYEPNRIPSSVFSGKPATATDWSIASNESLFSIHIADGSYSKEQFFMLYKSGELTKLDEQIMAQGNPLPLLKEIEKNLASSVNEITVIDESAEVPDPSVVIGSVSADASQQQQKKSPEKVYKNAPIENIYSRSDESTISTRSFVFPVFGSPKTERISSKNVEQNNVELPAQQSTEELQPPSPVITHHGASRRSWFSCFCCSGSS